MVFSSFVFLCGFLPAVLLLHTALRRTAARNALLIAASLLFYAYGEPLYVFLLLGSALINYGFGLGLGRKRSRPLLTLSLIFNLGLLIWYKYTPFLVGELNRLLPERLTLPVPEVVMPIGISFFTFQIISYLLDVYRGETPAQKNFGYLLLYISFFPQLIAGPIVKYHDVEAQIRERSVTAEGMKQGLVRFAEGLAKKVLIANSCAVVADRIYGLPESSLGLLSSWLGAVAYYFQVYSDFSAYSDMAIGLGAMFGFRFKENFNHSYAAVSVKDYWSRNHISLSTWFREYLYIPLGGSRKGSARTYLNLYIVFLATGIWHGANWTFVAWGLYNGTLLALERLKLIPSFKGKWRPLGWLYTNFAILLGLVAFRADTFSQVWAMFRAMFGGGAAGGEGYLAAVGFLEPYTLFFFLMAFLESTELMTRGWKRLEAGLGVKKPVLTETLKLGFCLVLLLLSLMQLATDSYNPFIYFRF